MGLFKKGKKKAERIAQGKVAAQQRAVEEWETERTELVEKIDRARTFKGVTGAEVPADAVVQLKKDESFLLQAEGAVLIEPRRDEGHYQAGSSGFSFKVAKGVRYRVGGTRGTYVPGEEQPTPVDTGTMTITNQRVVFQGAKQAREWSYSKLIGMQHDPQQPWTAIQVSNRQKVSGFLYDNDNAPEIRFRLALGVALFNDASDELAASLEQELAEHDAAKPPEIAPPSEA
jgi:hypothetical protein